MAMPVARSFRGDATVKVLAVAMLGTELAGDIKRGGNFNSNNNRYGGNQQRWNTGRGGAYVNRNRGQETEEAIRSSIDADLLKQTVQAVVAAVTAATKASEPPVVQVPAVTVMHDAGVVDGQQVGVPVAVPNPTVQQQKVTAQVIPEGNEIAAKDKENEGQGAPKKKEDKAGCFRSCHLLNAPKPTATLHGYANEALMFFELPCGVFKAKAENPKLAKVTVDGAALTIPEIIEQLKKIVPSEKFNWEVFHLKENIFRVKLPSKLEVQRLKNFGTYICTDRDACLTFDFWSSVEEPLYMLPEVWVRLSGLPSDIRSDYLSLWGVGTLFGKTLDVDMAYTRKNKVLRTKIGCLDHKLIPADSDMFIRRGFFKLCFEVEIDDQSQEVSMVDANNGFDGNDGANQGEGKNGGGHDMDMDNRGNDMDAASKDNEQDASSMHNGVDGMQEQLCNLDAIQIGTMHVKLASPDLLSRGAASGSGDVGPREVGRQPAIGQVLPAAQLAQHVANGGQLLHAGRQPLLAPSVALSPVATSHAYDSQAAAAGHLGAATCGRMAGPGSSVAREERPPAAAGSPVPQTIWASDDGGPGLCTLVDANHWPMIGNDAGVIASAVSAGLDVHDNGVAKGMIPVLNDGKNKHVVHMGVFQQVDLDFTSDPVRNEEDYYNAGIGGDCLISNVCW
ncbi:hypothetical protein ACQ4PT_023921 [Festuca glaucescens]